MSFLILLLVIATILFFGLPFLFLTNTLKVEQRNFLLAPFIGISIIILFLQNILYFNIPLKISAWFLWLLGICLWIVVIYLKKLILPTKKILLVFLTAFVAMAINGWGYIYSNYEECYGNCWIDQFNYVAQSQFMVDVPFNTTFEDIDQAPHMIQGVIKKESRIGQDMLNGFFAVTTFTETKNFFGAVILLMPFLISIVIFLLAQKFLDEKYALLTGFLAGISPILTKLHLENFLSHALSLGFLFLVIYLIHVLLEQKKLIYLFLLAITLSTTLSIYFEFAYILLGLLLLTVVSVVINRRQYTKDDIKKLTLYLFLLPVLTFLFNPYFSWKLISDILPHNYFFGEKVLAHIYPFALKKEMIPTLFFGDTIFKHIRMVFPESIASKSILLLNLEAYVLMFISILGWGALFLKNKIKSTLLFLCLGLLIVPLLPYSQDKEFPYQFFKLMISIFPLVILGLIVGLKSMIESFEIKRSFLPILIIIVLLSPFAIANISLVYPGIHPNGTVFIANSAKPNLFRNPKFAKARETLYALEGESIVLDCPEHIINAWLSYFGRKNNIWFLNDSLGGSPLFESKGNRGYNFVDLNQVPTNALLYTYDTNELTPFDKEEAVKIRIQKKYAQGPIR